MKKLLWGLLFLIFSGTGCAFAVSEKTVIKAGISDSAFSTYEHSSSVFCFGGAGNIVDMSGTQRMDFEPETTIEISIADGAFSVKINGKEKITSVAGPLVISSSDKIGIKNLQRKGMPAYYHGMIELTAVKPDKFNIVNVLDMQTYLKGVVPNEMPVSFGLEALKAQAVAARNYANRPSPYKNYDVCDSTACQVYYGANSQTQISDRAVDETKGIFALYKNEPILTLYSSTSGGITESYYNTFGNFAENKPYMVKVADSEDLERLNDEDFFKNSPPSFDMKSPKYRWKKEFTGNELEEVLSKTLVEQSNAGNVTPKFTEGKISGLSDIKILKTSPSRKVLEIEIKSKTGNYIVKKELPIRRTFRSGWQILPSANFITQKSETDIQPEGQTPDGIFDANNADSEMASDEEANKKQLKFTFYGAGFGHGVGMSQYGAGYLSSRGVNYGEILGHYYKGITLGTIPKIVSYNNIGLNYTQEFYFSNKNTKKTTSGLSKDPMQKEIIKLLNKETGKKCILVIDNAQKVSAAEFYINEHYFNPDLRGYSKKLLKTDITPYLVDGNNKITFLPLGESDKNKTLKFYVVLGENRNE